MNHSMMMVMETGGTIRWRDDRVKVICLLARGGGGETGEEGVQGEAASADLNQSAHPFSFVCILVSSASGKKSAEKKKKAEERRRSNASKAICQSTASSSPTNICFIFACHIPKGNWWVNKISSTEQSMPSPVLGHRHNHLPVNSN